MDPIEAVRAATESEVLTKRLYMQNLLLVLVLMTERSRGDHKLPKAHNQQAPHPNNSSCYDMMYASQVAQRELGAHWVDYSIHKVYLVSR